MAPGGKWIALCGFLDPFPEREHTVDCLDEYNRPLMEKSRRNPCGNILPRSENLNTR